MKTFVYYFHGLLISAFASVAVYVTFQDANIYSPPSSIWRATIFSILSYTLFVLVIYALTRNHETTGFTATMLILGLMYIWRTFLVFMFAVGLAWAALAFVGKKFKMAQLHISILAVSIAMAAYHGVQFSELATSSQWNIEINMTAPIDLTTSTTTNENNPDIYYIILDGYGSAEMLQALHGYDNTEFIEALEYRGFLVTGKSKSNYTRTILSLGSSLNMQYLGAVSQEMEGSYLWWPLMGTISQNQVRLFLQKKGYQSTSIANGWDFTSINVADSLLKPYPIFLNKFEELYYQSTNLSALGFLNKVGISTPSYDTHRRTVLFEFEQLANIPNDISSPKFVFVHIISPHAPFIFDENGSPLTPDYPFTFSDDRYFLSPPSKYRAGYLAQLTYINRKVLEAVDKILENSTSPPIIILQGDHGPGVYIDYHSAENSCLFERFSILNAYYLPGVDVETIPQDISPVNTFRMIFNQYFLAELEYLPNQNFFSPSYAFYQLEDVSERVNQPCQGD